MRTRVREFRKVAVGAYEEDRAHDRKRHGVEARAKDGQGIEPSELLDPE